MKPEISVALATYNGARYIAEQLGSLARQTVLPAELVISDDNSGDETIALIEAFAATAPFPVRIERNPERLGYRANFLKAANLCRADLIAFCDQDDIWAPDKLEKCRAPFEKNDVLLVYHDATVISASGKLLGTLGPRWTTRRAVNPAQTIDPWQYGLGFTLVFRRSLLQFSDLWAQSIDINSPENREAHDQWFFFLAASLGTVYFIAKPLVLYRQHGANTYGWGKESENLGSVIKNLHYTSNQGLKIREMIAQRRAAILEAIKSGPDKSFWAGAAYAARKYRRLEAFYRERQELYRSPSLLDKVDRLVSLTLRGGYRSRRHGGTGPRAFARDVVRGLLLPAKHANESE